MVMLAEVVKAEMGMSGMKSTTQPRRSRPIRADRTPTTSDSALATFALLYSSGLRVLTSWEMSPTSSEPTAVVLGRSVNAT